MQTKVKKVHLTCGDVYLKDYENCDIDGYVVQPDGQTAMLRVYDNFGPIARETVNLSGGNLNETTIDKYFKFPFEPDASKRVRRPFIIDTKMNILEEWPWEDNSVDELVMVNGFEHFEHADQIPFIINQAYRILKPGGVWKFDFPDIRKIVELYHDTDPEYCMNLIYCNHKNQYSVHEWGYTVKTIGKYLGPNWTFTVRDVVKHDYPSTGIWAVKK